MHSALIFSRLDLGVSYDSVASVGLWSSRASQIVSSLPCFAPQMTPEENIDPVSVSSHGSEWWQSQFEVLFQLCPEATLFTDASWKISRVNAAFLTCFGCSEKEILGKKVNALLDGLGGNLFTNHSGDRDNEEAGACPPSLDFRRRNGTVFKGKTIVSEITDKDDALIGFLCIIQDTTYKNEAVKALALAEKKAEEAEQLMSTFLANMSHEIRTPLNGIMGLSQLLGSGVPDPEERNDYINLIQSNGEHLLRIVSNVLDFAQIETNRLKLRMADFDLHRMLLEVYSTFESMTNSNPDSNVKLFLDHEIDNHRPMRSDETRLKQILYNLLSNAVKFTSEGEIHFGYKDVGENRIRLYVKDTGIGITDSCLPKVFKRFCQIDSSLSREYEGTGLGLAICKGLSDMFGGEIWVDSELGKGSTFYFETSIETARSRTEQSRFSTSKTQIERSQSTRHEANVLVVENNDSNFQLLKDLMDLKKAAAYRAINGEEAIEALEKRSDIALVVIDIKLQYSKGKDFIRLIRTMWPDLPVVAQTACTFRTDINRAIESKCDAILTKPIDASELYRILDSFLFEPSSVENR